jgi:hypothetical protein
MAVSEPIFTKLALHVTFSKDLPPSPPGIPQSVQRLATGWTVRGSNPGVGAIYSAPVQTGPGAHPVSYTMGTGSFPGVKRPWRGVDRPPHLAPRLKKEWSYTSTAPLGLRDLF